MAHSSSRLPSSLHVSLGSRPVTMFRSPRVPALLSYLTAEAQRSSGHEMLAGLSWPEWPDRDALTNLLAAMPDLCRAIGDSIATPSSFHVNPDSVHIDVSSDNWNYPSRGIAYARSRYD